MLKNFGPTFVSILFIRGTRLIPLPAIERQGILIAGSQARPLSSQDRRPGPFHRITSYLVLNLSEKKWVSREEAIELAENRKLRAVVVHHKKYPYLRPFPHDPPFRGMVC